MFLGWIGERRGWRLFLVRTVWRRDVKMLRCCGDRAFKETQIVRLVRDTQNGLLKEVVGSGEG